jgi:hypothetical protein
MKRSVLLTGVLAVALFVPGTAKAQKTKQGKKGQELPDVALVIPEDTRPEVRAIIKENVINLRSKKASERRKAAEVLGELKEAGQGIALPDHVGFLSDGPRCGSGCTESR